MSARDTPSIVIIDSEGRHQIAAPEGFDWHNYPGTIIRNGEPYYYEGTIEGTPHYRIKDDV